MADGTVKTLGPVGSGSDYTDISTAIAEIPTDITGTAGDYVIEVKEGKNFEGFTKPSITTDATHRVVFRAFSGDKVDGSGVGAGFESSVAADSDAFIGTAVGSQNDTHVDIIGLKIIHLSGGSGQNAIYFDDALNNRFYDCYIKSEVNAALEVENGGSCGLYAENCIFADSSGSNTVFNNIGGSAFIEFVRCTSVNSGGAGFDDRGFGDRDNLKERNCFAFGNANSDFGSKTDQSDCDFLASGDGTASDADTTSFPNRTTSDFEDYAGGNYNLSSGSTLKGAGEGGEDIGATLGSAPAPAQNVDSGVDFTVTAPAFSSTASATLPQPSADAAYTVSAPTFTATADVTLPNPVANAAWSITAPTFTAQASATLPNPSSDAGFAIAAPSFTASTDATLPQPSADSSFSVSVPEFSAQASATIPGFNASVSFDVSKPAFSATADATQPQPSADVDYSVQAPTFSGNASVTLPQPVATASFNIGAPVFSANASATEPGFNASVLIDLPAPTFEASATATLPQPSASVDFSISSPQFSVVAIVGGIAIIVDDETNINVPALSNNVNVRALSINVNT